MRIELSEAKVKRLDAWIKRRPHPQPSRVEAIRYILELGLIHGAETEYLQAKVAQADKDIREKFDRILGMIGCADESVPVDRPIVRKPH